MSLLINNCRILPQAYHDGDTRDIFDIATCAQMLIRNGFSCSKQGGSRQAINLMKIHGIDIQNAGKVIPTEE